MKAPSSADGCSHAWPPFSAKWKQHAMYEMRASIRDNQSVEDGYARVEKNAGKGSKSQLYEALLARDPDDGQNLLMYAVRWGRESWFLHLVQRIKEQLGFGVLVKQLRAWDINGTPLLCLAASSRSETTCFQTVYDKLRTVLGTAGLAEQVRRDDHMGRNILMHAARGNHIDVFKIVRDLFENRHHRSPTGPIPGQDSLQDHQHALVGSFDGPQQEPDSLTIVDITGRNVLHHAAEAGCLDVLSEVIYLARRRNVDMHEPDSNGLTPMHHLLRAKYGEPEGREELPRKFGKLWYVSSGWMKPRSVMSLPSDIAVKAKTELIHAARGGLSTLQLVLDKILAMQRGRVVRVDDALSVEVDVEAGEGQGPSPRELTRWGWGLLLAAAIKGGHTEVLEIVVRAIQTGNFGDGDADGGADGLGSMNNVKEAVSSIRSSGSSWFGLAILSGKVEVVLWVYRFIAEHYGPEEVWDHLCGETGHISPLTCAASSPMKSKHHGLEILVVAYECLTEAASRRFGTPEATLKVSEQFTSRTGGRQLRSSTPLVGAMLSGNWLLFEAIYDKYECLTGRKWSRDELLAQLGIASGMRHLRGEYQAMHEHKPHVPACLGRGMAKLKAVMWRDLVEAYQRAQDEVLEGAPELPSWRETLKPLAGRAVKSAAETGAFDDLRELVKEGLPIHDDFIPVLLDSAEDEEEVLEIVTFAVGNASNPLVMAASVSKSLRSAEADRPMHRTRLRSLQKRIDDLTIELLDKLPHTVRGMGMTLVRAVVPQHRRPGLKQQRRDDLAVLAGYMVVEWILEPRLLNSQTKPRTARLRALVGRYNGPEYMDPLQRALDRGSKALDFINAPLVMDYIHVKFSCTLPNWTSSSPIPRTINPGFYKYRDFDDYDFRDVLSPRGDADQKSGADVAEKWDDFLLRFLQGWDVEDMVAMEVGDAKAEKEKEPDESSINLARQQPSPLPGSALPTWRSCVAGIMGTSLPHRTALPMLQFSLAGVIGKPDIFFNVPAVRFAFEFLQFLVMLVLFCSSVMLQDAKSIPPSEIAFYIFMGGTLWREILEFCDGVPARHRHRWGLQPQSLRTDSKKPPGAEKSSARQWMPSKRFVQRRGLKRVASAVTRYLFHDTWNLVDTSTVVTVSLAFLFRVLGMPTYGGAVTPAEYFFAAQFFLALSAPLLFARLLRLSQIDDTLGPMTQIIWRMLSQTLRFGVFIVVVMAGFALAFHAMFFLCEDTSILGLSFGTFASALLYVFEAPLGEFSFDDFDGVSAQCPDHPSPGQASDAGIFLLVTYLLILAIIMLNLLVAVLSTAHGEVYENGEKEFHLARTRLIQQSARAVAYGRIPPPFNLVQLVSGFVVDAVIEVIWWCVKVNRSCRRREFAKIVFSPITSKYWWHTFDGVMQRFAFAFAMGLAAVALNALLWVLSLPWITWRFVTWTMSKFDSEGEDEEDKSSSTSKTVERGYVRTFFVGFATAGTCLLALIVAITMCIACIFGSCVLWLRGLYSVVEWAKWKLSDEGRSGSGETANRGYPTAMPGQEHGNNWRHAWEHVAKTQNFRVRHEHESEHFHVAPLLQSMSGLDMERLCFLTMKKRNNPHNAASGENGAREKLGEPDEPDPEEAGGYMFPVQQSGLPRWPAVLDTDFEPKVLSFLSKMREGPPCDVRVPPFPGGGRTDRDGTAVIPPGGGGLSQEHTAEANQESKEGSTSDIEHKSDDQLHNRADLALARAYSDGGRRVNIGDRSGDAGYISIRGSADLSAAKGEEKREADASALPVKEQPKNTQEPVLGISIWAPKLQEGQEYVSDEHGVRVSVPSQRQGGAQQLAAGPVLLERTAVVAECGEDAFFITSIVHCFPSGTSFAEPLLLEFAFEVKDGTADVRGAYKVLVREDNFHPWSVLESTEQMLLFGRGFLQARVEHAHQYTLGNIYNRSGLHVFRRRQFNLRGLLRDPAVSVLNVASDQLGLWNVSGYSLSVLLVLPNSSAQPKIMSTKVKHAPFDGASIPTESASAQRHGVGAALASNLDGKEADLFTAWSGKDDEAALLVATFKNGKAHLWATRSVKRGTCIVILPGCIEGKSPSVSASCAEHDLQSTILALHAAGNPRSNDQRNALESAIPSTLSTEHGK